MAENTTKEKPVIRLLRAGAKAHSGQFRIRISADKVLEFSSSESTKVPMLIKYKDGKGKDKESDITAMINDYIIKNVLTEVI